MKMQRGLSWFVMMMLFIPGMAHAADHTDSPLARTNASLDINDVYAFQSPENANNVVIVVTVNPFARTLTSTTLASRGLYRINIDTNGDAIADRTFSFFFSSPRGSAQRVVVLRENGTLFATGQTGKQIRLFDGGKMIVDLFDDPFFFDVAGFNNNFQFTGTDGFGTHNVTAIVFEIARSTIGPDNIGIWASTHQLGKQFDRVGRPAINTALIVGGARKDAFNLGLPVNDQRDFRAEVITRITALGNGANAAGLADVLLPDVLTIDTGNPAGFLNGRGLADDVIDAELSLLTNGAITTDLVNSNDRPFGSAFPYLAPRQ
jgi:hypothetical protein